MKKYTFIFAVCVMLALTACGSKSTTPETTDSLATQVDTSAITAIDSTTAEIPNGETVETTNDEFKNQK
jgi:ABC-type enterochelin transport system substrate-binding protein